MTYIGHYTSPLGGITLSSDGTAITGLWFDGQKYFGATLPQHPVEQELQGRCARFHAPSGTKGNRLSQRCVGNSGHHSLWAHHDLWGHC